MPVTLSLSFFPPLCAKLLLLSSSTFLSTSSCILASYFFLFLQWVLPQQSVMHQLPLPHHFYFHLRINCYCCHLPPGIFFWQQCYPTLSCNMLQDCQRCIFSSRNNYAESLEGEPALQSGHRGSKQRHHSHNQ